jgi:DNA-binding NtrC family response regulator
MDILIRRDYPGNVRELAQIIENAVLLADTATILPRHMGEEIASPPLFSRSLCSLKENYETHVIYVLNHTRGDRKQAAQILGITVRQLQRKIVEMRRNPRWRLILGDH